MDCVYTAASLLDNSTHESLQKLIEVCGQFKDTTERDEFLEEFDVNPSALDYMWRVRCLVRMELLCFLLGNVFYLSVGSLAVVAKVSACTVALVDHQLPLCWVYLQILGFANQIVGIFSMEELLRNRVFVFVFGGTDAKVQAEERYLIDLYMGNLLTHIWQSNLSMRNKLALLFKLDDDDIQQLVIEEDFGTKAHVTSAVHTFMKEERLLGVSERMSEYLAKKASSYWNAKYD